MRKYLSLLLVLTLLRPVLALGEARTDTLSVSPVTGELRPSKAVLLTFTVPRDGLVDLRRLDDADNRVSVVVLVVLVQIITVFGTRFTRGLDHKKR